MRPRGLSILILIMELSTIKGLFNLDLVDSKEIFGGALIFFCKEIFLACDLSWNDELNFRVVEPQESR